MQTAQSLAREPAAAGAISADNREGLRRFFAENGYVIIENVVPRETLARLTDAIIAEYDRASSSGELFAGGGRISGHLNVYPGEVARAAYQSLVEQGVMDFARELFRDPLGGPSLGMNLNLPGSKPQHYHVDSAFTEDFLIVNTAMVDTEIANGAIDVIPGTQKKSYPYWRFALERPYRYQKQLPMKRGDVLVRTSTLWHRGMPNHTTSPRPMFAVTLRRPKGGTAAAPAGEYDPFARNGGKIEFYENWYRPTRLGRIRERIFVSAPIVYSGYRFVKSLVRSEPATL